MKEQVNNEFYNELGGQWYASQDDAIALLRRESEAKNPWVHEKIAEVFNRPVDVLDIGCGGGFLSNYLAARGHKVTGLDQSSTSLQVAREHDTTQKVDYLCADATAIPLAAESFDVVCAMDFLEHVEHPEKVVEQVARLLRPGGIFIFHTFNRNPMSYLVVIKLMEWFVPGVPKNLHLYRLFIRPRELENMCLRFGLEVKRFWGLMPHFFSWSFISSILSGKLHPQFRFKVINDSTIAYLGVASKR